MTSNTIEHKVSIFISSKCNGKYEIMRKALRQLLLETGLTEVYCFETEPGSSESMPSAYLQYVDLSQLLILIVDNKDGISDATMSEFKRARELGIRILAFFCNERSKKKTEAEQEIITQNVCKFVPVSKFSDIAENAYKSVLQDVIAVYMKKKEVHEEAPVIPDVVEMTTVPDALVSKHLLDEFDNTRHAFASILNGQAPTKDTTEIDVLFQEFLQVILCRNSFDKTAFSKLKALILKKHETPVKEVIEMRLEALESYFSGDIDACVKKLDEVVDIVGTNASIPRWIHNDIAIDLRNMISMQQQAIGRLDYHNKGQNIIDTSSEYLYFPSIDRLSSNIKENVIKEYNNISLQSPYTTTLGGGDQVFADISSYFCVALLYGSITHLKMVRRYIVEILQALTQEYIDQRFNAELVRLLIIQREGKTLKSILRTYNKPYDIVTSTEIEDIIKSIKNLPLEYERTHAMLLLIEHLGNYLSDGQFAEQATWLSDYVEKWIKAEHRIFNFHNNFKSIFQNCHRRFSSEEIAGHILTLLQTEEILLCNNACELMRYVSIKDLSPDTQTAIQEQFVKLIREKADIPRLKHGIVVFCMNATIDMSNIEEAIKENLPDFYNGEYNLEVHSEDKAAQIKHIDTYLQSIKTRIEIQGKNGCYSGFMGDPCGTIENIITMNNLALSWKELNPIVDTVSAFVLAPNQSCGEKLKGITLLTTLVIKFSDTKELIKAVKATVQKQDEIFKVISLDFFDKISVSALSFALDFLSVLVGTIDINKGISSFAPVPSMDDRDIIACLDYIHNTLEKSDVEKLPDELLLSVLHITSFAFGNKECDIRFFAIKCLIELTRSKYKEVALKQLSLCMDGGSSDIKIAIISRMPKVPGDSATKEYIIQKAKVDNHYAVRQIANEI